MLCLVIFNKRGRDEILDVAANDNVLRRRPNRRRERQPLKNGGFNQVGRGDDADSLAVANENRLAIGLVHPLRRGLDRVGRVDEHRGTQMHFAQLRLHGRAEARFVRFGRGGVEFPRNLQIKERGEARIVGDEPHHGRARQQVTERFLRGDECVPAAALDQRAAIERVAGSEPRDDLLPVALLDMAFHDDEQELRRSVARQDRLAGAKIADVERGAHGLDLWPGEAIKRSVGGIET